MPPKEDVVPPASPERYDSEGLAKGALKAQITDKFLEIYLPKSGLPSTSDGTSKLWQLEFNANVIRMSSESTLLSRTVSAMSLCNLAGRTGDVAMDHKGVEMYGAALLQLNQILQKPEAAATDNAVIPAIALMGMYEQFNGFSKEARRNQSRNWQAHTQGVARLLQMKGPDGFSSEYAFMSLVSSQLGQFASAFSARKGTFLAQPEWRTTPWRDRQKTPRDHFFDIVFPVPGMLQRTDNALTLNVEALITEEIEALLGVLRKLNDWWQEFKKRIPSRLVNLIPDRGQGFDSGLPMADETAPPLHELDIMNSMLQFWAVSINIIVNLRELITALPPHRQAWYRSYVPDPLGPAAAILRVVPLYSKYGGIVGSQIILYPLGAVRNYIYRSSVEQPDACAILGSLLKNAVRDMEYAKFVEGFLGNIPTIRGEVADNC